MVQILEVGSPAFDQLMSGVIKATKEVCKMEFENQDDIITQEQAMAIMKVKSKQKMEAIRESKIIKSKMLGGEWRYSRKSIIDWINK